MTSLTGLYLGDLEGQLQSRMETITVPEAKQAGTNDPRSDGTADDLLPGIPNEITLTEITPKLSGRDCFALPLVCRAWRDAIQSRQVYQARLLCRSLQTLVLISYTHKTGNSIILYSMTGNSSHELPPIPNVEGGFPKDCHLVALDGKVYIMGGSQGSTFIRNTYVFDLAGQRKWKSCADMIEPKKYFGCGVMGGNIYVFGGVIEEEIRACVSEVYDPEKNTWSQINPLDSVQCYHHVATARDDFFMHGGYLMDVADVDHFPRHKYNRRFLDVFTPVKDQWTVVKAFSMRPGRALYFMADGKLHAMSYRHEHFRIHVHDRAERKAWKHLHSTSATAIEVEAGADSIGEHEAVLEVDGEILAIVFCAGKPFDSQRNQFRLLRTKGLRSKTKKIKWDLTKFSVSTEGLHQSHRRFSMNTIQL